ncbi:MAG: hypothetical protein AAB671_00530 [Patescibacteria group bacterium]
MVKYQGGPDAHAPAPGIGRDEALSLARYAGLSATGVAMNLSGYASDLLPVGPNWIKRIQEKTVADICRAMETRWDPGRPDNMWGSVNFGRILLEFQDTKHPGEFLYEYQRALRVGNAVMFDGEYDILNPDKYPLTEEDADIGKSWGFSVRQLEARKAEYVALRVMEVAMIFRLMSHMAQQKHPGIAKAVVFSAYPNLVCNSANGATVEAQYGVSWAMMADRNLSWRSIRLPQITHAMVAWNQDVLLPGQARVWARTAPLSVLHVVQLAPSLASDPENWARLMEDRIQLMRRNNIWDDGFGLVNLLGPGETFHQFDLTDKLVYQTLGNVMRERGFMADPEDQGF